jgi:hypothetical protein
MPVPKTTIIPAEMCSYVLSSKLVRPFQVFVYLKSKCSGKIKLNKEDLDNVASKLGLKSERTVKYCLKKLIDSRWIGFSPRSGFYFIKGYDQIRIQHKFYRRRGAEFSLDEIKDLKAFLIATTIGLLINAQKRRRRAVEPSMARSKTPASLRSFPFEISNEALAKILGISVSTAFEWKNLAAKQGYIKIRKHYAEIDIDPRFSQEFKNKRGVPGHLLRYRSGKLCIQKSDTVVSHITFRRRAKITEFNKKTNSYDTIF